MRPRRHTNPAASLARELRDDVRDDLRDSSPTLDADFHHPCPKCGAEVVIRAAQPIRRARCTGCRLDLALDRRIGGALCLLPFRTREHENDRRALHRARWLRSQAAIYLVAALIVGSVLGLCVVAPVLVGTAGAGVLLVWSYGLPGWGRPGWGRSSSRRSRQLPAGLATRDRSRTVRARRSAVVRKRP